MNELIKLFFEKGFLFPIQAILIAADVYFVAKSELNNYLLLSLILVISTIVLQTVRRRFLLLYPVNLPMNGRSSVHIDTYYLRVVLILSTLFLVLGVSLAYQARFYAFDYWVGKLLPYSIPIFLVLAPLLFWFNSVRLNDAIAEKLKEDGPSLSMKRCPFCSSQSALHECKIKDKNNVDVKIQCLKCGKSASYQLSANIGE